MASSTASPSVYARRRQNSRRQPLARSNTLLGAIKNIVTAPLSWFASTDDFEDSRDNMGKRRRLSAAPTELALDEGDRAPRTKRMRVDSPSGGSKQEGYLDPPAAVFQQPPSITRSASAGANLHPLSSAGDNGHCVRSAISPFRNLSISRTMSVDPPPHSQTHDGGVFQSQRPLLGSHGSDMSIDALPLPPLSASSASSFPRSSLSMPRDLSAPYSRPPFRMRSSLTPQPSQIQRERSEPPPLQSLMAKPTFLRPPLATEETPRAVSSEPTTTLGSLVDSARQSRSLRQQGSLLFGNKSRVEPRTAGLTPAEKALHELEIYKTPLLPTRLRTGPLQSSVTGVPDLFKSRRTSRLVLMKDEKRPSDRQLGKKEAGSPDKNVTKPYAGEGGMKKLLAKRKLELEGQGEKEDGSDQGANGEEKRKSEKGRVEGNDESMEGDKGEHQPLSLSAEIPPVPKQDWYSLASGPSGNSSGSSLRVGRAKASRNHISRPTARSRSKFSAAFEDDGDDTMLEHDKEKELLDEAAKKVPAFNLPAGFSFLKDAKPIEHDSTNAKEPPIKSLPFSLSASPAPVAEAKGTSTKLPQDASSAPPRASLPLSFESPTANQEQSTPLFGPPPTAQQPAGVPSSNGGVPNFFAQSAAFNKPLEVKTLPLNFGLKPAEPPKLGTPAPSLPVPSFPVASSSNNTPNVDSGASSLFGSPVPNAPVKDVANPLWDGEKNARREDGGSFKSFGTDKPEASTSLFGVVPQDKKETHPQLTPSNEVKANAIPAPSLFGDPSKPVPATSSSGFSFAPSTTGPDTSAAKPSLFSFGPSAATPAPAPSLFGNKPATETGPTGQTTSSVFGGQAAVVPSSDGFTPEANGLAVANASSASTVKPTIPLFGDTSTKAGSESGKPSLFVATPTSSTTPFSFSQPATSTTPVEAPKPVDANSFFSFASSNNDPKPASPAPFTFGTPDKNAKAATPAPFTFGGPSTPTTSGVTGPFTFGTPSSSPAPPSTSTFSFGAGGGTTGDMSKPLEVARPVTPPRNPDQEFQMEESPTREIQQSSGNSKPAFGGFSFGNHPSTGSVLSGGPSSATSTSAPFSFGSAPSPNPFAPQSIKESKSEEPKQFGFGQSTIASSGPGFSFGQSSSSETPRPSTTGSFNFGNAQTSTASGFNFAAAPTSNPFGQPAGGSAPSSPSTFQPSTLGFGAPSGNTPFSFGSQPASPAGGNTSLPQATTPVTFGSGNTGFGSSTPSSPFNAPAQITPSTSSGGTLFTIGAPPPQGNAQGRAIKKLPTRNRAKR